MNRIVSISILLLLLVPIKAQDYNEAFRKLDIHFNPIPLMDYNPRIRMGIEYNAPGPLAYNLEVGIGKGILAEITPAASIFKNDYSFYEVRPEIKYYYHGQFEHIRLYSSMEVFGMIMHSVMTDTYFHSEGSDTSTEFDRADLDKFKSGAHMKTGIRTKRDERICFDLYFGIGLAYRNFTYSNIVNPVTSQFYYWEEWIPRNYKFEGERIVFHLTAGFKIGYMIF